MLQWQMADAYQGVPFMNSAFHWFGYKLQQSQVYIRYRQAGRVLHFCTAMSLAVLLIRLLRRLLSKCHMSGWHGTSGA